MLVGHPRVGSQDLGQRVAICDSVEEPLWGSLMVQWLRRPAPPMQGAQVHSLCRELEAVCHS